MKASVGDSVVLRAPGKTEQLEIVDVEYAAIPMEPFRWERSRSLRANAREEMAWKCLACQRPSSSAS
jgi:hypothetical protein